MSTLKGKKIVFMGSFTTIKNAQTKKKIEKEGGVVLSSVSRTTDIVVCGEGVGEKKKKEMIEKYGVEVWDEGRVVGECGERKRGGERSWSSVKKRVKKEEKEEYVEVELKKVCVL